MFTAYFDASRSGTDDRVVTVGGFVAPVKKWDRFGKEWKELLRESGTGATMFHMTDFVGSRKPWQDWKGKTNERREYMDKLVSCIDRNTNKGFAVSLMKSHFSRVNSVYRVEEEIGPRYALCGLGCIGKVVLWAEKRKIDPKSILYIFEDGDPGQGRLISSARAQGFNAIPQSKATIRQFDACDIAAWKARATIDDSIFRNVTMEPAWRAKIMKSLRRLELIVQDNGWCTLESLSGICLALGISRRV